jgi:hypothetical protein
MTWVQATWPRFDYSGAMRLRGVTVCIKGAEL